MLKVITKLRFIIIIILLIFFGVSFYVYKLKSTQKTELEKSAYTVDKKDLTENLTLTGKIQAEEQVSLRFKTSGKLVWIGVKEGDTVKKYQAIASLDQEEVKKALDKKLNSYLSERWDFEQTHDDYEINGNPITSIILTDEEKRIIEKAQFDLDNSVLDVEIADLALKYSHLYTPIAGMVTSIDEKVVGNNITAAGAEFEITNMDSLYLSVLADQSEVIDLNSSMPATITLDSFPDKEINSQITFISYTPKSGETGTVYEVRLTLPKNDKFRIGMSGDASFITKKRQNVLVVPINYLYEDENQKYVYTLVNGKKTETHIKTGQEIDDYIEVLKGLSPGDKIYD